MNGKCIVIDTESTFRPERITEIAKQRGLDQKKVLKNIFVAKAYNSDHQVVLAEKAKDMINEHDVRLIVVDSLMSHFRSDYSGRGELAPRQQKLNRHIHALQKLADTHNIAVYVTNQVMARPDVMFGDPTAAVGGHIVGHACVTGDTLIQLSDGSIKQIKDVQPDEFISANFKSMKLEKKKSDAKFVNREIKDVYEIDTGSRIKASPLHRFFRLNNLEIEKVRAQDLKEGDWLLHAGKIDVGYELQSLPEIETEELVTISEKGVEMIMDFFKSRNISEKGVHINSFIKPRQFRRFLNQGWPTNVNNIHRLIEMGLEDDILDCVERYESYKHRRISMPTVLTEDVSQVLGYFLGDGNLEKRSLRFTDSRKEVLEHYRSLVEGLFGIISEIRHVSNKNAFRLEINSIHAKRMFEKIKDNYMESVSKSPAGVVAAFIRGFADAKGYVSKERPRVTIAQKSEQVIKMVQMLLVRFGIRSAIWDGRKAYKLIIDGRDIIKFKEEIGLTAKDKALLLEKWAEHCDNTYTRELYPINRKIIWNMLSEAGFEPSKYIKTRPSSYKGIHKKELQNAAEALLGTKHKEKAEFLLNLINGDVRIEKIKKIKKLPNSESLYDISIPENHNYIANGFVVHNSTYRLYLRKSKANKRIARLIDSPNMPEGEAIFSLTEKGIED
jgi:RecA/RadA recombinase